MSNYKPNKWVILKMTYPKEVIYKVLASWYGGYLGSDSWKLNSGITKIKEELEGYEVQGYSGSTYYCSKGAEGMSNYTRAVLQGWLDELTSKPDHRIKIIDIKELPNDYFHI